MASVSKDSTIKVELDKVFELHRCEVINDVRKTYETEGKDSLTYEQIMKTLDELEASVSSQLEVNQNKSNKNKTKVKRNPTVYNIFVQHMIKQLKDMYPETDKNELMRECGKIWSFLTSDEKFDKSDEDKIKSIKLKDLKNFPSFAQEKAPVKAQEKEVKPKIKSEPKKKEVSK
jgi:hypothetical protein